MSQTETKPGPDVVQVVEDFEGSDLLIFHVVAAAAEERLAQFFLGRLLRRPGARGEHDDR